MSQSTFYADGQSDEGRGHSVGSFLNDLIGDSASVVGTDNEQIRMLRDRVLEGLTPYNAFWHHYVAGQASSKGYERAMGTLDFPADYGPHWGFRNEQWSITGNVLDESGGVWTIVLTFHRFSQTPPYTWNDDQSSQSVWRVTIGVTDPSASYTYNVYVIPSGIGLSFAQNNPFTIELGTEVALHGTMDTLFPMTVEATDANNGNTMTLTLTDPHNIRYSPEESMCLDCSGGVGTFEVGYPELLCTGQLNGNQVAGTIQMNHTWEYGHTPLGYPKYFYQRSLQTFKYKFGHIPVTSRTINVRGHVRNSYFVDIQWIDAPNGPDIHTGTIYCTIFHTGVIQRNVKCSVTLSKWIEALDGFLYPNTIEVTLPEYSAQLEWNIHINQFTDLSGNNEILSYDGRAGIVGTFLGEAVTVSGFISMSTMADHTDMARICAGLLGVPEASDAVWAKPNDGQATETFFYWFMPALFGVLIIAAIWFIAWCCFGVKSAHEFR